MKTKIGQWWLRDFADGDRDALVKYANNPKVAANLRDRFPSPYTEADADAWLILVRKQSPRAAFAIASGVELVGGIGLELGADVHRRSAEIGYWLGEPFWNLGIATLAVNALTDWAFRELDLVRVYANVFESNPASGRVLEKAGYAFEGRHRKAVIKRGVLMDELVYAMVRARLSP